jgi:glycerol-3-phosphate dehydrogenase (NAD(P)+)
MDRQRENARYLPGIRCRVALQVYSRRCAGCWMQLSQAQDLADHGHPHGCRPAPHAGHAGGAKPLSPGCARASSRRRSAAGRRTAGRTKSPRQVAPAVAGGVLSGPSFAQEVARGQPCALVAASRAGARAQTPLVDAFHGPTVRVYGNEDLVGVEVGGAVKNVLAIATGLCDGLGLGLNARAALITRGLAEMTRLGGPGRAGADIHGPVGPGRPGAHRHGRPQPQPPGRAAAGARASSLQEAMQSLGHVAEGVYSARTVVARAKHAGVEMPIAQSVVELLEGRLTPAAAVAGLMGREPSHEIATGS